jgi:hypothetical protein
VKNSGAPLTMERAAVPDRGIEGFHAFNSHQAASDAMALPVAGRQ